MYFFLFKSYPDLRLCPSWYQQQDFKTHCYLATWGTYLQYRELIIIFSLVLKIILKREWLPHQLKELKQQSKVLELFPNQCNSHIPPEPAVGDLRCRCGEGRGRNLLSPLGFQPLEIRTKVAPGAELTRNWVLS